MNPFLLLFLYLVDNDKNSRSYCFYGLKICIYFFFAYVLIYFDPIAQMPSIMLNFNKEVSRSKSNRFTLFSYSLHAQVMAVWNPKIVHDWTDDDETESPTWQTAEPRICGGSENISLLSGITRKGYFRDFKLYQEELQQTGKRFLFKKKVT